MRAPAGSGRAATAKSSTTRCSRRAPVPEDDLAAGSESDRHWFARERWRSHRLRRPIGREAELLGCAPGKYPGEPIVVTRQFAPGIRLRNAMTWVGGIPPNLEPLAHALFDAASDPGRETITADELRQRAAPLARAGEA